MDAATISAVVLPLVGVALGTVGTLTGQYLATSVERRRHRADLAAAVRDERKETIAEFLSAAQSAEQAIDNAVHRSVTTDRETVDGLLHQLWLSKKLLELVCSHELARAAHAYTKILERMARDTAGEAEQARQLTTRGDFMEAARRELGVPGPRLYPGSTVARQPTHPPARAG